MLWSGIWSAAMDGDLERVKSLVQKGADPNMRDAAGYTALVSLLGGCLAVSAVVSTVPTYLNP